MFYCNQENIYIIYIHAYNEFAVSNNSFHLQTLDPFRNTVLNHINKTPPPLPINILQNNLSCISINFLPLYRSIVKTKLETVGQ